MPYLQEQWKSQARQISPQRRYSSQREFEADWIGTLRRRYSLSQEALAVLASVSVTTVQNWENPQSRKSIAPHNQDRLRDIEREPIVELNELDARQRGIAGGAMVRVFNDRGSYLCKAIVSPRARPGVVNGLGVWWRKFGAAGTNVNELTHQRLTDIGRAPSFYDCLVDVAVA